jgi:hypothetical protein
MLGLRMVRDALAREPRLYALGMGGWDKPLPQMLKRLGWSICAVPFHFKVVHPARFLREVRAIRTSPLRRLALDAAAYTGAGWLGMKALGIARRLPPCESDLAPSFTPWADEVWERSSPAYALLAQRDAATLDALYPPSDPRFLRVRVAAGWAVVLDTQMRDHKQFGDMRVGTIVDCLGPPESASTILGAATSLLERRGVDLIVSNQLHAAWSRGLAECGFRTGPSNYLLALSPALAQTAGVVPTGTPGRAGTGAARRAPNEEAVPNASQTRGAPSAPASQSKGPEVGQASSLPIHAQRGLRSGVPEPRPASPPLDSSDSCAFDHLHFNRGDGDGPIHL